MNAISHVSQPFVKSEWAAFHDIFRAELEILFANRFRSEQSIAVNLMYSYFMRDHGKARFHVAKHDRLLNRHDGVDKRDKLRRELLAPGSRIKRFCLNDTPVSIEDGWRDYVNGLVRDVLARPAC